MLPPVALRGRHVLLCFTHAAPLKNRVNSQALPLRTVKCNRFINPCAQSGRRTWTVDKWHIEHYGGKVHANSVAEYSERLVVTCLGVNGVTRTCNFPGIVLEARAPPAAKVLSIV